MWHFYVLVQNPVAYIISVQVVVSSLCQGYEGEPQAYIATQGPMAHTIVDFWQMVWHQRCPIIVMITKLKEKSKVQGIIFWVIKKKGGGEYVCM